MAVNILKKYFKDIKIDIFSYFLQYDKMNSILTESVYKLYEQIQKFFYINENNSSDTNKNIIDECSCVF